MLLVDSRSHERGGERLVGIEPRAHAPHLRIDGVGSRLGRRVALDFGEHELAIDQLREQIARRIGAGRRCDEPQVARRDYVGQRNQLPADHSQHPIDDLGTRSRGKSHAEHRGRDQNAWPNETNHAVSPSPG